MRERFAMAALAMLVVAASGCGDSAPDQVTVNTVAYTPDGTLVVETNDGLYLFGPASAPQKGRIALDGLPASRSPDLYRYSLSADGTVAAVSYSSGDAMTAPIAIVLYRIGTGQMLNKLEVAPPAPGGLGSNMLDLALSPHGDLLGAVWFRDGEEVDLAMIDTATAQIVWMESNTDRTLVGWSVDGTTLYALNQSGLTSTLEAYDGRAGLKWSRQFLYRIAAMRVTADGATLVGMADQYPCDGSCPGQYSSWSAVDGTLLTQQPLPQGVYLYPGAYGGLGNGSFACSTTHDVCAMQLEDDGPPHVASISVYQTDGTVVPPQSPGAAPALAPTLVQIQPTQASSIALSPDGQLVAWSVDTPSWGSGANRVDVYRIAGGALVASHSFDGTAAMH